MPPIVFFPFTFPGCEALRRVHCAFTTRRGGASRPPFAEANLSYDVGDDPAAVADNRRTLARRLGVNAWCECRQVHGDLVHIDPAPQTPETLATLEGDGVAPARPGAALAIKTAD
ncbi:MAG: laccase domain-containing protein, partial [Desulfovibrionaceae bacterium]